MQDQDSNIYEFGDFILDIDRRLITRKGHEQPVALVPKAFDALAYLALKNGEIVDKDELMSAIWPDTIVEENNLSQQISAIRKALGENRGENRFILTVPGRGFKFVAEIEQVITAVAPNTGKGQNAEQPGKRVDTQHTFVRRLLLPVVAIIAIGAIVAAVYYFAPERLKDGKKRSLAVLPFKPLVAANRDEVLEMGMTDTLIARLGSNEGISVRPLSAVRKFGSLDQDGIAAGNELGVDFVLEGSFQQWGNRIRVNVRLLKVSDGTSFFSETFDEKLPDIFSVQDAISEKVVTALAPHFAADVDKKMAQSGTKSVEAYRYYLQGRYFFFKLTPPDIKKGIEFFQKAVEVDSNYADAYSAIALSYVILPVTSDVPSQDAFPKAKAAAIKAASINPDNAAALMALARISFWYEWNWAESERQYRRSIENDPGNSDAHLGIAHLFSAIGRHDEALRKVKQAREIDPYSRIGAALEGQFLMYAGRLNEAETHLRETAESDGGFWVTLIHLGMVLIEQQRFEDAAKYLSLAVERSGGNTETESLLGYALAKMGKNEEAVKILRDLEAKGNTRPVPPYNIAMLHNGLGNREEAMKWLERAFVERDMRMTRLKVDQKWEPFRSDPRFAKLMKKMQF